ncbi:MAG: hypothetical protein ACK5Z4_13035 [Planctomyces sp.]
MVPFGRFAAATIGVQRDGQKGTNARPAVPMGLMRNLGEFFGHIRMAVKHDVRAGQVPQAPPAAVPPSASPPANAPPPHAPYGHTPPSSPPPTAVVVQQRVAESPATLPNGQTVLLRRTTTDEVIAPPPPAAPPPASPPPQQP